MKVKQDATEAKRLKRIAKLDTKPSYDADLYEAPSSDPYIQFSIDPPANPGCKIARNGGYFGRSVRIDTGHERDQHVTMITIT